MNNNEMLFVEDAVADEKQGPMNEPKLFSIASGVGFESNLDTHVDAEPSYMQKFRTGVFPFLLFKFPNTYPFLKYRAISRRKLSWIFGSNEGGIVKKGLLHGAALEANLFLALLTGCLLAISCVVLICFSYNPGSSYPTMDGTLFSWLIVRNFAMILLMHFLCLGVLEPNPERIKLLHFENDGEIRTGVLHSARWLHAKLTRCEFRKRWFSAFLSDSILLSLAYLFYFIYAIMCAVLYGGATRIVYELSNIYRSSLTWGFIVYALDYAPKSVSSLKAVFRGILLLNISLNIGDFFVFIGDKPNQPGFVRAFGAGAQLFITHSCVLLIAILFGHHHQNRMQLVGDLPWGRGLIKLTVASVLGLIWLVYALFFSDYSRNHQGAYLDDWIAVSYPYALWVLNVAGGIACIAFGLIAAHKATSRAEEPQEKLSSLDMMMVLVSFSVAAMYYSSQIFAYMSLKQMTTSLAYWITSTLAPIGLSLLAWVFFAKNFSMYFAFFLACAWLSSIQVAEDCHLNSPSPLCCQYPGFGDVNEVMTETPEIPICSTSSDDSVTGGNCLLSDNKMLFTAVTASTRAVQISVSLAGFTIFSDIISQDLSSLVTSTTCRDQETTYSLTDAAGSSLKVVSAAGCFGQYLYALPPAVIDTCRASPCIFSAAILNCAFVSSPPLFFVSSSSAQTFPPSLAAQLGQATDQIESAYYQFYVVIGMAGLVECFFTLLGVFLKLVFVSECQPHPHYK